MVHSGQSLLMTLLVATVVCGAAGCAGRIQRTGTGQLAAVASVSSAPAAANVPLRPDPVIEADTLPASRPVATGDGGPRSYRIGEDDELEISVYGEADLSKTQTVRPDGKIAFPLVGDVQASGLTPDELRAHLTQQLARFVHTPRVTVIVSAYKSKRVTVLGEVQSPGIVPLSAHTSLLEAISAAGGVTEDADLEGAMLVRQGRVMPADFARLLRGGEVAQNNLPLEPADVILIPNIAAKKVFVLGEVQRPLVTSLKYQTSLVELVAMAGGFTRDAERATSSSSAVGSVTRRF
jgi:polysaccharide biosynthesis/export protein